MANDSSILAWRVLWIEEPRGLLSIGSHRVRHNWSDLACMPALEKEMANHSSILAWRIQGTGERGVLPSMGSHRVRHDWSNLVAAAKMLKIKLSIRKATHWNIIKSLGRLTNRYTEKKRKHSLNASSKFIYKCNCTERLTSFWRKLLAYKPW